MQTKLIDGRPCQLRDVVYSDFGATTDDEKNTCEINSEGAFKTQEGREARLKDVEYSWNNTENPYEYNSDTQELIDDTDDDRTGFIEDSNYSGDDQAEDKEFSIGTLPARLIVLKRPVYIQLKDLYREHARVYKSKGRGMKPFEIDLLMNDFRYELLRIIAIAKNKIASGGGNMETILKINSIKGGKEMANASRKLTILFKRIEKAYDKYGFVPRNYQVQLNDNLNVLVNTLVIDVYGPEIERRKVESANEESKEK